MKRLVIFAAALGAVMLMAGGGALGEAKGTPAPRDENPPLRRLSAGKIQLVAILKGLRDEGRQQGGDQIEKRPPLWIGAVWTPMGAPTEFRPWRLAKKVAAGADFIQTQGIYDMQLFRQQMQRGEAGSG